MKKEKTIKKPQTNDKNANCKISIVIPCYNVEKYIAECLDSILSQSLKEFEIICVDDCSTDKTLFLIKKYADERIKIISYEKNKGTSQARKDGVLSSVGKYIMFVDPDDTLAPNALEIAYKNIEKKNTEVLQFGTNVINCGVNENAWSVFSRKCEPYNIKLTGQDVFVSCFQDSLYNFNLWNKIYNGDLARRSFSCVKDGYFPKAQDMYAEFIMLFFAKSYDSVDDKLYNYYFGRGITGKRQISEDRFFKIATEFRIIEELYKFIDEQASREMDIFLNILKKQSRNFFNEVFASFGYVENLSERYDDVLLVFLDSLIPQYKIKDFKNKEIYSCFISERFYIFNQLYYYKNINNNFLVYSKAKQIIKDFGLYEININSDVAIFNEIKNKYQATKKAKDVVPVVFATNDNYAPYLSVAISSLLANASEDVFYDIYVFHTTLAKEIQYKIKTQKQQNCDISFVDLSSYIKNLRNYSHSHYSVEMYYRLFISEILKEYPKVVYLDCDIVLNDDVKTLYETDIGENILTAVVNDVFTNQMKEYVTNNLKIELNRYFNSGVLVINTKRFNELKIKEKCLELLNKYEKLQCPDQDILNLACNGNVLYLTKEWNYQVGTNSFSLQDKYLTKHKIIHYTTGKKPWNTRNLALGEYFWKYARTSPFYEDILKMYLFTNIDLNGLVNTRTTESDLSKKQEKTRNIINKGYKQKSLISWPIRNAKRYIKDFKEKGFKYAHAQNNIRIRYVINRLFGKVDKYNNPILKTKNVAEKKEKVKDYEYYKTLAVKKYPKELETWYNQKTNSNMDIENPGTLNEKIQWLKIYDASLLKSHLTDKWLAKEYIKKVLGKEYIIKTLGVYDKFEDIDFDRLPNKFVIKSTHGSGQVIIVKDKSNINKNEIKQKVVKWLSKSYGYNCGFEVHYNNIIPRIIVEEFAEGINNDLYDYKFMCVNGKVKFIWVDCDRFVGHKRNVYDTNWKLLPVTYQFENSTNKIPRPKNLKKLISISEKLAKNFSLVRCDFYILNDGTIKFGELTFTSGSGIDKWDPISYDAEFGKDLILPEKHEFKKLSRKQILDSEKKFLKSLEN